MKRIPLLISIALLAGLLPSSAGATIIVQMDLPQLVGRSDVIFVGRAIKTHSHWTTDGRHIVTDTTFEVSQTLRGPAQKTLVVRRMGGAVGEIGMRVSGMPVFEKGDEVLLFTEKRATGRYVVGMKQGVYRVSRTAGKPTVRVQLDGLTLARRTQQGRLKLLEQRATPAPVPLGEFVDRVRETITRCAKEKNRCRVD